MPVFSKTPGSEPAGSRRRLRRLGLGLAALVVIAVVPAASLANALTAPGTDPLAARAAEWARGHGLGFLVTAAEELTYRMDPPKQGGRPDPSLLRPALSQPRTAPGAARAFLHAPLDTIVSPSLPGEGVFRAVVSSPQGPAVQLAYLRPDPVHTSYLAAVMIMNPELVRFVQHPGYAEPGQLQMWKQPDLVAQSDRGRLAATFNGGFKLGDAQGGYYADGHTVGTLQPGAASMVITRDGRLTVGSWADEVGITPQVVSVRQNLRMLIDHGQTGLGRDCQRPLDLGCDRQERRLRLALRRGGRHSWQRHLRDRPGPLRTKSRRGPAPRRSGTSHGVGHQPDLDLGHVVLAPVNRSHRCAQGLAIPTASRPLPDTNQPRLHRRLHPLTTPFLRLSLSSAPAARAATRGGLCTLAVG